MIDLNIFENESAIEYLDRIYRYRYNGYLNGYTWDELAEILNSNLNYNFSESKYRKDYYKYEENQTITECVDDALLKVKMERVKLSDERTQANSLIRALSREETLKEIARESVRHLEECGRTILPVLEPVDTIEDKEAILTIGDWHYGLDVDLYLNQYNPEIAKERVSKLANKVIDICEKERINRIHVVNLGDMISGNIHLPLRLNSRKDVISQTMEVSEIISEFLSSLMRNCIELEYYSVVDNHSRYDPNKKEALQTESFVRIIDWYLKERFRDCEFIAFNDNKFGDDIANFKVLGHEVLAVHGDKDPQKSIIPNLTTFTKQHYDLILSAHLHHFSSNEHNETEFICNGSLIGTDQYANSLRLNSKPSQTLIVSTPQNITECIYKIKLD